MNIGSLAGALGSPTDALSWLDQSSKEIDASVKSVYCTMLNENVTDIFQADEDGVYVLEITYENTELPYHDGKMVAMLFPQAG
jgi:hypothetical protein